MSSPLFVGRREELETLRRALAAQTTAMRANEEGGSASLEPGIRGILPAQQDE